MGHDYKLLKLCDDRLLEACCCAYVGVCVKALVCAPRDSVTRVTVSEKPACLDVPLTGRTGFAAARLRFHDATTLANVSSLSHSWSILRGCSSRSPVRVIRSCFEMVAPVFGSCRSKLLSIEGSQSVWMGRIPLLAYCNNVGRQTKLRRLDHWAEYVSPVDRETDNQKPTFFSA